QRVPNPRPARRHIGAQPIRPGRLRYQPLLQVPARGGGEPIGQRRARGAEQVGQAGRTRRLVVVLLVAAAVAGPAPPFVALCLRAVVLLVFFTRAVVAPAVAAGMPPPPAEPFPSHRSQRPDAPSGGNAATRPPGRVAAMPAPGNAGRSTNA